MTNQCLFCVILVLLRSVYYLNPNHFSFTLSTSTTELYPIKCDKLFKIPIYFIKTSTKVVQIYGTGPLLVFLGQSGILLVLYISLTHSTRCVLLLLLLTLPPVREVCPNHELVMFQPWTENSLYVGSFDILTLFIVSPSPPDSTIFWIFVFLPQAYSCLPPSVTIQRRSTLYLSPASPPELARARRVHPPGCCPHPLASIARPCS